MEPAVNWFLCFSKQVYQQCIKNVTCNIRIGVYIKGNVSVWEFDMRISVLDSMFRLSTSGKMGCGGDTGRCTHIFFFFLTPVTKQSKITPD